MSDHPYDCNEAEDDFGEPRRASESERRNDIIADAIAAKEKAEAARCAETQRLKMRLKIACEYLTTSIGALDLLPTIQEINAIPNASPCPHEAALKELAEAVEERMAKGIRQEFWTRVIAALARAKEVTG
jgi:hypothetical protein